MAAPKKPIGPPPEYYEGSLTDWVLLSKVKRYKIINRDRIRIQDNANAKKWRTSNHEHCAAYKAAHADEQAEKQREKQLRQPEELAVKKRAYRIKNAVKIAKQRKDRRDQDPAFRAQQSAYRKEWFLKNPEKRAEYTQREKVGYAGDPAKPADITAWQTEWCHKNAEKCVVAEQKQNEWKDNTPERCLQTDAEATEKAKEWRSNNPEKVRAYDRRRRVKKQTEFDEMFHGLF
jgi:hypothetical protein